MTSPTEMLTPHELFRALREQTSLFRDPTLPTPVVIAYENVDQLVASKLTRCQEFEVLTASGLTSEPIWSFWREIMFSKNGAEHTRLRQLIRGGYTKSAVDPERPMIRARTAALIEQL